MANTDTTHIILDRQFTRQLNTILTLYNADLTELCEKFARELVADSAIPRYHRIRVLTILASVVNDTAEAKSTYLEAQALWRTVRDASKVGDKEDLDKYLDEIREELDGLRGELDPDGYWKVEEDQALFDEEMRATIAGDHGNPMGMEEDKPNALGAVTDDMRSESS